MHQTCHIGRIIRIHREKLNLTIEKAAELCGMSVRGYVKIELGDSDPKWTTLIKIITVLEIEVEELAVCANMMKNEFNEPR